MWAYVPRVIRLVVAEDNLLVRRGIVGVLALEPDIDVVAQASSLSELLAAVAEHDPGLVLTDVRMPPGHSDEGVRAAAALRRSHPELGVVVLSQYDDPSYALRVFEHGVARRGYLLKDHVAAPEQLVSALLRPAGRASTPPSWRGCSVRRPRRRIHHSPGSARGSVRCSPRWRAGATTPRSPIRSC
jgi:DNA-binding NarL/FixJ family response regulator